MKAIAGGMALLLAVAAQTGYAGNKDRIGSAGAMQLNLNPWARSSSFANANSAMVTGIEATYLNVSGLAFVNKTDINYNYTSWLQGAGIGIHALGLGQRLGEFSVIGGGFTSLDFGDITTTTTASPDGGQGTYRAQFGQFYLAYAREFSNSIYAGITVKVVSEGLTNAKASGVAFDFGIRYVTGKHDNLKFAISLKNIGARLRYKGDGLATKTFLDGKEFTLEQRAEAFEMPSALNIGISYDILIGVIDDPENKRVRAMHRLTPAFNFMANSFGKDQVSLGIEYSFKEIVMIRGGYLYEADVYDADANSTVFTGPSAGLTAAIPLGKKGSALEIDYGFRANRLFSGTHTLGLRLNL